MNWEDTKTWVNEYDLGILNDYGGGDIDWWWNYIRKISADAREHYQELSDYQAEDSFKAGQKEVADWINKNPVFLQSNTLGIKTPIATNQEWISQLEEWGIEKGRDTVGN